MVAPVYEGPMVYIYAGERNICYAIYIYIHALQVMIAAIPLLHMMVWMKKMNYEILESKTV